MLPRAASMAEFKNPAFLAKINAGPNLLLTVSANGMPSMSSMLGQWFVYCVVVTLFAAYLASHAVTRGGPASEVARFVGVGAFAGYSLALLQAPIWYRRSWRITLLLIFDGLVYALITGATFVLLWP